MIKRQLLIFVVLMTGVAIGYFVGPNGRTDKTATTRESPAAPTRKLIADRGESASVAALRRRVSELEAALSAALAATNAAPVVERREGPPGHGDFRARMEELRKKDPARFAQMTNNIARFTRRRQARERETREFLASIDVSRLGKEAQKTHARLQELNAQRAELEERLHDENLSDDDRKALFDEMRSMHRETRELNRQERENLLNETARTLGFAEDEAKEITETIQSVIRSTEGGHGGPPPGPSPGPRPQ